MIKFEREEEGVGGGRKQDVLCFDFCYVVSFGYLGCERFESECGGQSRSDTVEVRSESI